MTRGVIGRANSVVEMARRVVVRTICMVEMARMVIRRTISVSEMARSVIGRAISVLEMTRMVIGRSISVAEVTWRVTQRGISGLGSVREVVRRGVDGGRGGVTGGGGRVLAEPSVPGEFPGMYLRHLHVEHLKRIASLDLDFTNPDGTPRMWTVLIGENGTAKTSILQAIGLAAAGYPNVGELAGDRAKHMRDRRTEETLKIDALFDFPPLSRANKDLSHPNFALAVPRDRERFDWHLRSVVEQQAGSTGWRGAAEYVHPTRTRMPVSFGATAFGVMPGIPIVGPPDPLAEARSRHLPHWFVAGYGIERGMPSVTESLSLDRPSTARLKPLFSATKLASTGFSSYFDQKDVDEGRKGKRKTSLLFAKALGDALEVGEEALLPTIVKFSLRGPGGPSDSRKLVESDRVTQRTAEGKTVVVPVTALSHGFQSTFAWIADLIGHVLLEAKEDVSAKEMEGLVLIDELDLYLHPTWQATIVGALRKVFPKMQFIASTHSPVVLSSLAPEEIVRLTVDPETGDVVRGGWNEHGFAPNVGDPEDQPDPRLMSGGEIFQTWFGIDRLTPNALGERMREYRVLFQHPDPTPTQRARRKELRNTLLSELTKATDKAQAAATLASLERDPRAVP